MKSYNKLALRFSLVLMIPLIFMVLLAPTIFKSDVNPIIQNLFALIPFIIILPSLAYVFIQSSRGKYNDRVQNDFSTSGGRGNQV